MPAPEIVFDLERTEPFECGAVLLAVLAFPEEQQPTGLMESCQRTLCALAIRARVAANPEMVNQTLPMRPAYAFQDPELIDRDSRYLAKRLRHRMLAAKMCIPLLIEAQTGVKPELPLGITRLSINQMTELVLAESGNSEPKNIVARIWRPSLPVIHLAVSITIINQECLRRGLRRQPISFADLMISPALLRHVVEQAEQVEALLAKSRRAHIDANSLIRFRLAA